MLQNLRRRLQRGQFAVLLAAIWSAFDALLHVAVDMVEPPRIAGNVAAFAALALVSLVLRLGNANRVAGLISGVAAGLVVGFNAAWAVVGRVLPPPAAVFIVVAVGLLVWGAYRFFAEAGRATASTSDDGTSTRWPVLWVAGAGLAFVVVAAASFFWAFLQAPLRQAHNDELEAADYWADELVILSAGLGFDNIVGLPDDGFDTTLDAGGAWYENPDCVVDEGPLSSAVPAAGINILSRGSADYDDGLPVVVSWPVLTSTVHPEDFLFTLNDGSQVMPNAATMIPNWELNERNTLVVFGDLGNRLAGDDPDAIFPVKVEIVDDGTPLMFVGPDGVKSGVGLTWETDATPYNPGDSGPRLVGAKLNRIGDEPEGEGGVGLLDGQLLPNDEFALYGGGDFKVRILTTGGFSPDGLTGVTPDQYEDLFRLHATGPDGETVLMTEVGVDYELDGGTLRVVGLSDLGRAAGDDTHYDDCYAEDSDNYIDIILEGDEEAARGLTHLEIPASSDDAYLSFYNPGGPGPEPFPDVSYTAPGPPDLEPIINALDDPMRVSYP